MDFAVFAANEPLISNAAVVLTKTNFGAAVGIFFKRDEYVAHFQAYVRRYPAPAPQSMPSQLNRIWDADVLAHGAPTALNMSPEIDALWRNSIRPDGEFRLQTERTHRNTYYTTGAGAGEYPDLDEYAKEGIDDRYLDRFVIAKRHLADYASLLTLWAAPYLEENKTNKYNATHKQAIKLAAASASVNGGGDVNSKSPRWTEVIACANFWIKEMPLINARSVHLTTLQTWAGGATVEKFFRLVAVGEKDFVVDKKVISQGPSSFERHKWFFFAGGAPGVDHKWKLTINVKGPAIAPLIALAEEVSDESKSTAAYAFLKKSNEPNCIGIHEDLLEAFCSNVVSSITAGPAN